MKQKPEEALEIWGKPSTLEEVRQLFAAFCVGQVTALPWSEGPAAKETSYISAPLAKINELGYLTINSQPAVDGVKSSDAVHGWGPKNGYVYQKVRYMTACTDSSLT
jgi:methylenetetrahydrofolate reductase (NADPH)